MRNNQGVTMNAHVGVSYGGNDCDAYNQDMITVSIHCRDYRDGAIDTEKAMAFTDTAHGFCPNPVGPEFRLEFLRAWNKIEGWLQQMGVDCCCHAYVIDIILKCSRYQFPDCGSLFLDVHVELADGFPCPPKQRRLHPRDGDVEEGMCFGSGGGLKRFCTAH